MGLGSLNEHSKVFTQNSKLNKASIWASGVNTFSL